MNGFKEQRYMSARTNVSKFNWARSVLPELSDVGFRTYVRMNRISFAHVINLIQRDSVFQNNAQNNMPQTSVEAQLMYALWKLDHYRASASFCICSSSVLGILSTSRQPRVVN